MASWRARGLTVAVRMLMRRLTRGDERTITHRARRIFGAPNPWQWLRTRGVRIDAVQDGQVRGEWITAEGSDHGVVLYLHGGGYIAGSPATDRPISAGLARLARRRVFSPLYRLAPEHRFPAALEDAAAAYRWVLAQGTPPRALTVVGMSAGGGLALALLVRLRDERLPLPASAVCFSPWTDLACTGESLDLNHGRCPMFRPEHIRDFARIYLGDAAPRDPYASPVFADLAKLPPLLLQVASAELLLDDARRVHDKIGKAGGVSKLEVFEGVFHGWQMLDGFLPEARAALRQAAAFMNDPAPAD